jgi:uncharacterized protein YdaT
MELPEAACIKLIPEKNNIKKIMPWTSKDYPNSMKNLPAPVRKKAIEIGNALLEEDTMMEGVVIATAISRAKDWAANRGLKTKSTSKNARTTDVKKHGEDRYVIPFKGEWAVKEEGKKKVEKVLRNKKSAVKKATSEARNSKGSVTIQRKNGRVQKRVSFTPHKGIKTSRSTKQVTK